MRRNYINNMNLVFAYKLVLIYIIRIVIIHVRFWPPNIVGRNIAVYCDVKDSQTPAIRREAG